MESPYGVGSQFRGRVGGRRAHFGSARPPPDEADLCCEASLTPLDEAARAAAPIALDPAKRSVAEAIVRIGPSWTTAYEAVTPTSMARRG